MLQDFFIIHRRKPHVFPTHQAPVWSTCLRSLAFTSCDTLAQAHDQVYQRNEAYHFLLEIICGMHSPILGETEVFGQFKKFAQEWTRLEPRRQVLIQRLMSDAKQIRSQHLRGIGNQSYGSWIRRQLKSNTVHILGGGHLAQEILPYVQKQASAVHLHVREPSKIDFHLGSTHALQSCAFTSGALIVAAPMNSQEISGWLGNAQPFEVFDLRDCATTDSLPAQKNHHRLQDIFTQIEETKSRLKPVAEKVQHAIAQCTQELVKKALIRPQGWDDLCA